MSDITGSKLFFGVLTPTIIPQINLVNIKSSSSLAKL